MKRKKKKYQGGDKIPASIGKAGGYLPLVQNAHYSHFLKERGYDWKGQEPFVDDEDMVKDIKTEMLDYWEQPIYKQRRMDKEYGDGWWGYWPGSQKYDFKDVRVASPRNKNVTLKDAVFMHPQSIGMQQLDVIREQQKGVPFKPQSLDQTPTHDLIFNN